MKIRNITYYCSLIILAIAQSATAAVTYFDIQNNGSANGTPTAAAVPYTVVNTGAANGTDATTALSLPIGSGATITFDIPNQNAGGNNARFFTANDPPNANNIDGSVNPVIKEGLTLRNGSAMPFTISGLAANQQVTMYVVQFMKPNQATAGAGANWSFNGNASTSDAIAQNNFSTWAGSFTDLNLFTNIGTATGGGPIPGSVTRPDSTFNHVLGGLAFDIVTVPEPQFELLLGFAGIALLRRKRSK